MKGKLIVLDGTDGSGKATQTKLLLSRLKQEGYEVTSIDFPQYGSYSAAFVEKYLRGEYGSADEIDAYKASLFYALDRFAAKKQLEEWLEEGKIIIANRYVSSNMIHQAGKIRDEKQLESFLQWLDHLEFTLLGIPRPEKVLFLNVPPLIGQQLVDKKEQRSYLQKGRKRDIHEADKKHLLQSYERACSLVKKYDTWQEIICINNGEILSVEEIGEKIFRAIETIV